MINKKTYIAVVGTALAFTSAFALTVFAEEMTGKSDELKMKRKSMEVEKRVMHTGESLLDRLEKFETKDFIFAKDSFERGAPATLTINPHGKVRMTGGAVTGVSGDIVTVEIWKLSFSVHKMPETKVFAGGKKELTFEQIAVGDKIDVLGQLDDTKASFIHAGSVHDRTQLGKANDEERSRIQALINELLKRLNALSDNRGRSHPLLASPSPSSSPNSSSSPLPSPSSSASSSPLPSSSPSPSPSQSPS